MMMTKLTKDQAQALTALVTALRSDWDPSGVMAALRAARDRGEAHEVAVAAVRAAATATNRTPAVIALAGPHWDAATVGVPSTVPRAGAPRCPVRDHEHEIAASCRCCRSDWLETGQWPVGSEHVDATRFGATTNPHDPDVRERAAGDHHEETR